jgi:hypothetical protein
MNWNPCCNDSTPNSLPACPALDPGIVNFGTFICTLDYAFNQRRLANPSVPSVLFCNLTGSGQPQFTWTNSPQMLPPSLPLALQQTFTGLLAAVGPSGYWRALAPTAPGFLACDALGNWAVQAAPMAVVPAVLNVTTSVTAPTATFTTLQVSGAPTFSGLAAGTITQNVGLNSSNQLVTGSIATGSSATYFESTTLTYAGTSPNNSITASGQPVVIGSRISDDAGLITIVNATTLQVVEAGTYVIDWSGRWGSTSTGYNPLLSLAIGNSTNVVANGNGPGNTQYGPWGSQGKVTIDLEATQNIYIVAGGTFNLPPKASGLSLVTLNIQKIG